MISQAILPGFGKIARFSRQTGLGGSLAASRNLLDSIFIKMDKPPLQSIVNETKLHGYLRHRSYLEAISTSLYEPFTRDLYANALKPGIIVVDGGAHIGLFSILAAQRLANCKIFSFEPDPYNFRALLFNLRSNQSKNVLPIRKAISDSVNDTCFFINSGTISSSLIDRKDIGECRKALVQCTTLDHEFQDLAIDSVLIKLDLEGAEPLALQGMHNTLQAARSAVVISEINPKALRDGGRTPEDLVRGFRAMGFKIHFIDEVNRKLIPVISSIGLRKGNLYCTKEN
jgi:FkbM family methyltransferase